MNDLNLQLLPMGGPQKQHPILDSIREASEMQARDKELREVSQEFETMMVAKIMKQGLKTARQISENEDNSSNAYMDMAYEQMAEHMGRNSSMGLGEAIYESLKQKLR